MVPTKRIQSGKMPTHYHTLRSRSLTSTVRRCNKPQYGCKKCPFFFTDRRRMTDNNRKANRSSLQWHVQQCHPGANREGLEMKSPSKVHVGPSKQVKATGRYAMPMPTTIGKVGDEDGDGQVQERTTMKRVSSDEGQAESSDETITQEGEGISGETGHGNAEEDMTVQQCSMEYYLAAGWSAYLEGARGQDKGGSVYPPLQ